MEWLENHAKRLDFLHQVLSDYRNVRQVYAYDHEPADVQALRACATDMRPFTYSFIPSIATFWLGGRLANVNTPRPLGARIGLALLRLGASLEVFRLGWMVGNVKQAGDCVERMAQLRTALGGEIVAIIRERDPASPLLKLEQQAAELNEDGSRPRIRTEANRLKQLERLNSQMTAARRGYALRSAGEKEDERLSHMVDHQAEVLGNIRNAGGPSAVAATGDAGAIEPRPDREAAGSLVRQDVRYAAAQEQAAAAAAGGGLVVRHELPAAGSSDGGGFERQQQRQRLEEEGESAAAMEQDVFAMLLGGGGGGGGGGEGEEAEPLSAREIRRAKRRARWWVKSSSKSRPADDDW